MHLAPAPEGRPMVHRPPRSFVPTGRRYHLTKGGTMTEPVQEPQTTDADDVADAASTTAHTLLVGKAVRGQLV